jgi:hypothetical protein
MCGLDMQASLFADPLQAADKPVAMHLCTGTGRKQLCFIPDQTQGSRWAYRTVKLWLAKP